MMMKFVLISILALMPSSSSEEQFHIEQELLRIKGIVTEYCPTPIIIPEHNHSPSEIENCDGIVFTLHTHLALRFDARLLNLSNSLIINDILEYYVKSYNYNRDSYEYSILSKRLSCLFLDIYNKFSTNNDQAVREDFERRVGSLNCEYCEEYL